MALGEFTDRGNSHGRSPFFNPDGHLSHWSLGELWESLAGFSEGMPPERVRGSCWAVSIEPGPGVRKAGVHSHLKTLPSCVMWDWLLHLCLTQFSQLYPPSRVNRAWHTAKCYLNFSSPCLISDSLYEMPVVAQPGSGMDLDYALLPSE